MRRHCYAPAIVTAWTLLAASHAYADFVYVDPLYGHTVTKNIVYATGATKTTPIDLLLDVYQPEDIGLAPVPPNRPAIVIQDGGAWTSGSKDAGRVTTPAKYFADRGYTVFVTDYRQIGDNPVPGPGPWSDLVIPGLLKLYPGAGTIRSGIEDFSEAITFVRDNAATYGIDVTRVAATGGSAGGINAMLLAYNNPPAAYAPQAVLGLVSTMYDNYNLIDAGEPPAFLLNSKTDLVIQYNPYVKAMVDRMEAVGLDYEPWEQDLGFGTHDVDYDYHPYITGVDESKNKDVLQRMRDFLVTRLAGGPLDLPDPGDANWDGFVDGGDYTIWADHYLLAGKWGDANFNNDGIVDGGDYTIWADNYAPGAALATATPEPSTLVLAALGALLGVPIVVRRRRRGVLH